MAHQIASSVNCSLDEIDLGALKVKSEICVTIAILTASIFQPDWHLT